MKLKQKLNDYIQHEIDCLVDKYDAFLSEGTRHSTISLIEYQIACYVRLMAVVKADNFVPNIFGYLDLVKQAKGLDIPFNFEAWLLNNK